MGGKVKRGIVRQGTGSRGSERWEIMGGEGNYANRRGVGEAKYGREIFDRLKFN